MGDIMKICVCDDDKVYCNRICDLLQEYEKNNPSIHFETEIFCNFSDCCDNLINGYFDIVFMDIEIGKENGIDLIADVKADNPNLIVIYVSAYPNYVFDSFETEPINFITKPVNIDIFNSSLGRAIKKYNGINQSIAVKWHHTTTNLLIKDICFVEGYNRHIVYHLNSKQTFETVGKLSKIINLLEPHGFVQSHQGFLVNMQQIKSFGEDEIYMKNGDTVLMSVRRKLATKQAYYEYLMRG